MLFKQGESGFGQRPEQSLGWRNQSLFGVGHRLLRPVNAYADELNITPEDYVRLLELDPAEAEKIRERMEPPRELFVNLFNFTHRQSLAGIVLVAGLLGVGFVGVMPPRAARTRASDALEFGILAVLITVCTPYTFTYYFVWMIFPLTVLVHRGLSGPTAFDRRLAWGTVAAVTALFALSAPLAETREMMAYGVQFWAAAFAAAGCGWALVRERRALHGRNRDDGHPGS